MKSMVKYSRITAEIKGGNKVKKFSLVMALALALMLTLGVSVALAAPGDYDPDTTSDKYNTPLTSGGGYVDSTTVTPGLVNANQTGKNVDVNDGTSFSDVIKNVEGHATHGEYTNDTNSCASCHQTHTASGRDLLFKNGVYNTCTACHDGTLGFYNVFQGSNAGTFGGDPDKAVGNASVHMATGVMTTSAAPGGNRTSTDVNTWGKEFTCASCHAPHGSYSDRLLHYNPNNMGATAPTDAAGNPTGGKKIVNATLALDSATGHYTAADADGNAITEPWLYGYTYGKPKAYWSQIRVLYDSDGDGTAEWNHKVQGDPTKSYNDVLEVHYNEGYFTDPSGVLPADLGQVQMDVAPATVVKVGVNQIATAPNNVPVNEVTTYVSGVNAFCAACHTDYNANSAAEETGTFSSAFRHKISQGLKSDMIGEGTSMVCLTCHFAHGTDAAIMLDAQNQPVTSPDVNASSALKRYTNMAVCWKCHSDSKAETFKNTQYFWDQKAAGTNPTI